MSNQKRNGLGYCVALVACAAAIGCAGWLYYRNAGAEPVADTSDPVLVADTDENDVAAVARQDEPAGDLTPAPTQPQKKGLKTAAPVAGQTVAVYAMDSLSYNQTTRDWRVHNGVDITAEAGTPVRAAAAGTVYTTYADETMGTTVVIRHGDGYTTKYASLSEELSVQAGDTVELGQEIGCVGQTALLESAIGDHVHFSVTCNDVLMDPAEFLAME